MGDSGSPWSDGRPDVTGGRLLSRIPTHVISEDGEGILLLCAWLTAHSPYWALASASGTGEEAAGRANLCRHICPRGIWTGVLKPEDLVGSRTAEDW